MIPYSGGPLPKKPRSESLWAGGMWKLRFVVCTYSSVPCAHGRMRPLCMMFLGPRVIIDFTLVDFQAMFKFIDIEEVGPCTRDKWPNLKEHPEGSKARHREEGRLGHLRGCYDLDRTSRMSAGAKCVLPHRK